MEVWVGIRPPMDLDAFGRSDSEGAESRMHAMDVFMWGRCLTEDEILTVHNCTNPEDYNDIYMADEDWQGSPMETPMRVDLNPNAASVGSPLVSLHGTYMVPV